MERLEDLAQSIPDRVTILKKARVTKLVQEGDSVVGVEYEHGGQTKTAHGPVILATGGYAADFTEDSLLKKYRPELWDLPTTNGDHCTGDGQKLAMAIGGKGGPRFFCELSRVLTGPRNRFGKGASAPNRTCRSQGARRKG